MPTSTHARSVLDQAPATESFREAALEGLRKPQKHIPAKFLYDARGSELFDQICRLDEYYPTRTEIGIMRENVSAMAEAIGPAARLVEYGSGSSLKTRILLEQMGEDLAAYVPVDISKSHLLESAEALAEDYPAVPIQPVCADYTTSFELPEPPRSARRTVGYYPGSVADESFAFDAGETIHTEDSHKYTLDGFASLAADTGFEVESVWTDDRSYFSVQYCTTRSDSA